MCVTAKKYYFDTNAMFKYYRNEAESMPLRRLVAACPDPALVSQLTILEFVSRLAKAYRKGELKKRTIKRILDRLKKDIHEKADSRFQVIKMPVGVFRAAEIILRQYSMESRIGIGSLDALHVAIVTKLPSLSPVMVTWDKAMQRVCEKLEIEVYSPD
ncbi:type II toxin-antitoxin system VapC family toxin [Desulfobacterales bacterium HSG16]|nr:type II toxin-antitoxin system VapC family toxin [Desulfobacterales bacterium HSG16]